eukprot:15266037-Alexandrium_andersonii.AAC.1
MRRGTRPAHARAGRSATRSRLLQRTSWMATASCPTSRVRWAPSSGSPRTTSASATAATCRA